MQRTTWKRPGCFMWLVLVGLGWMVMAAFTIDERPGLGMLAAVAVPVGAYWLMRLATTRTVSVCPHCGVGTNDAFRVCRSCGRVKG